jgi:Ca-activated chloride channel family protein
MNVMLSAWFAHPTLIVGLAASPVLTILFVYAWLRRRRALAALGSTLGVRRQLLAHPGLRRWRSLCVLNGVVLVALACAGPQWGREYGQSRASTGDLVVVLDLSRSMQAEQPSRQERALRMLRDLADTLEQRGGRRVAVVAFAAEARLLFPLTQDYDHFRHIVRQIHMDDLPPLVPGPDTPFQSGTRIGAGLRLAVATAAAAHAGRPTVFLLSDGDDPASADEEWLQGVQEARSHGILVHTVGIGDPDRPHAIPDGADVLRYQGKEVRTRLNEALLEDIARRTGGAYLPAHTHKLPLGTLAMNLMAQQPIGEDQAADDALPVYRQQYAWFLAPGLVLLLLSLFCNEGPAVTRVRRRGPAMAAGVTAFLVGAATLPEADPLVRQGNAAFAGGDYDAAIQFYDQAERGATDPGLLAFNRAAAFFRLGRFAEAALGYRQCLEDDQAPVPRRTRALYDLGTALLKQSGGASVAPLRQSVGALRACLAQPDMDADLRKDARHNLELAHLLLLRARAANPNDDPGEGSDDRPPEPRSNRPRNDPTKKRDEGPPTKGDAEQGLQQADDGKAAPGDGARDKLRGGALQMLPDSDSVQPLPPAEAEDQLARIVERIARERRLHWQQSWRPAKDARNW